MKVRLALATAAIGFAAFFGAANAAVLTYQANLSGAAENPPNLSTGTGAATVAFDPIAHTLNVYVSFADLLGNTISAHIHGPIAEPGNAGVITATPTFPGFPLGVTSGIYSQIFDTLNLATYNASFVTNNGGTAASAEAALAAALAGSMTYFNIHTTQFAGGEIRGFLSPVPVPVPAALPLFGSALAGLGLIGWHRRKNAQTTKQCA